MNQSLKRGLVLILIALVIFGVLYFTGQNSEEVPIQTVAPDVSAEISPNLLKPPEETVKPEAAFLDENGSYTTKEDVALYLHQYGRLRLPAAVRPPASELHHKKRGTGARMERRLFGTLCSR